MTYTTLVGDISVRRVTHSIIHTQFRVVLVRFQAGHGTRVTNRSTVHSRHPSHQEPTAFSTNHRTEEAAYQATTTATTTTATNTRYITRNIAPR